MYSLEELKKKSKNYKSEIGPSREDVLYQKYTESKPQKMKVSGGTVNPTIVPDQERESYATLLKKSERDKKTLEYHTKPTIAPDRQTLREMIFGKSKQGGTVNPTISAADFSTRYDTMADKEKSIYSSYKRAGKEEEAKAYLKAIEPEINKRAAEKRVAEAEQLAKDSTVGGLYARYMASLAEPLGTIYGLVQESRGEAIDPYHPLFLGQQIKEGQEAGFIGADTGTKKYLKQAALGAFDWGTQAATLGAAGLAGKGLKTGTQVLYGSGAFGGNLRDATLRGGTTEEAILYGAAGAAAETLAEGFGFEKWMKLADTIKLGGRKGDLVKHILKSAGTEALEEGATEGANLLADTLILGDKSRMAETYQAARMQGMDEGRATWAAIKAGAAQIGESALVGGMSGGMIGGGIGALTYGTQRNPLDYTEEQKEAARLEKETARQERAAAQQRAEFQPQAREEPVQTVDKSVDKYVDKPVENIPLQEREPMTMMQEEKGMAAPEMAEEVEGFGEKFYGAKGKEAFVQMAKERGDLDFTPAFNTYYRAGIAGIPEAEIKQNAYLAAADKGMLYRAYLAGGEDRQEELITALMGKNKLSGERGLILGEDVKATEAQMAVASLYADIGGARIRLVNKIDSGMAGVQINGYQEGNTITIALNAESFMGTLHHEMIHYIKKANPTGFDTMREVVFRMANRSGMDLDAQLEEYQRQYEDTYGEDAEMSVYLEEMVADAFQRIAGDETSLKSLLYELRKTEPTLLERIKEFLDKMFETLESLLKDNTYTAFAEEISKDRENLRELRKTFAKAMAETGKKREQMQKERKAAESMAVGINGSEETAEDTKFSISYTEDGRAVAVVDRDILKDIGEKEWEISKWDKNKRNEAKKIAKNALKRFGEAIPVNGIQYRINRDTRDEYAKSNSSAMLYRKNKTAFADKMRLAENADDIILATTKWKPEKAENPSKDYIKKFVKGDVLFISGGRKYKARTVIGIDMFGEHYFYDVTWVEEDDFKLKEESPSSVSGKAIDTILGDSSRYSLAQKENNVNRKFSLKKPVEETKELIAVHNISEEKLEKIMELGAFPMPSIAITRDMMTHEKFGEISFLFRKDTIDPADKRNKVFSADAWTATFPKTEYELDEAKKEKLRKRATKAGLPSYYEGKATGFISSLEDRINSDGGEAGVIEEAMGNAGMQALYLQENGTAVEIMQMEKPPKYSEERVELYEKIAAGYDGDFAETLQMSGNTFLQTYGIEKLKTIYKDYRREKGAEEEQLQGIDKWDGKKLYHFIRGVFDWQREQMKTEKEYVPDYYATEKKMEAQIEKKAYREWLTDFFEGIEKSSGIPNGKERFTPAGNRRSFAQTHVAATLDNIIAVMKQQSKSGKNAEGGFGGIGTIRAATSERFKSIEELRAGKGRLREEETIDEMRKAAERELFELIKKVQEESDREGSNPFIDMDVIGEIIQEEAGKKYTAKKIQKALEGSGFQISEGLAERIKGLLDEIKELPVLYFEAKPERAVDFSEVAAVIVPDNISRKLERKLKETFGDVRTYEWGDAENRLKALNSVPDVKFSIKKENLEVNIAEGEHWKEAYEGLLREFEITKEPLKDTEAARKVVRRFLRKIKSGYDEERFLERFVSLCNYGADMTSDSDYKDLVTAMKMLAEDALKESAEIDYEQYNKYAGLRMEMKNSALHVTKETLEELKALDIPYDTFRKRNFGKLQLSKTRGGGIDTYYEMWQEEYPELFKLDTHTSAGEMLIDIAQVREALSPVVKNPYFGEIEDYAESFAYELLGEMNDIALEKRTFADKYEEKLQAERKKSKEALKNAREQAKHEKELLQKKYADHAEARIAAIKEKYEKRLDRQEYWRLRKLAVKDAKALAEWLKAPTDKNHVPKKFKESVETVLGLIQTEKPDLRMPVEDFIEMKKGMEELYGDTQGIYLYVERDDQVINILQRFIDKYPKGANLDTMDATDMKYFRNLIASVKKACTDANKLHTSMREKSVVSVAEGFIGKSKSKKDAKETGMIRRINDFFGLELLDANSFFKRMGGDIYWELWKGLRKGMDRKIGRWRETMDFIHKLVDPKKVREWTNAPAKEFTIKGETVYLTIPQIMSLSCLMRRSQARQHIVGLDIPTEKGIVTIRGGGFKAEPLGKDKKAKQHTPKVVEPTEGEIREILSTLTEEQAMVAYEMQQYLSKEVASWGNETTMELFGYEKFTTENYFPIVSDRNFVSESVTKVEEQAPSLKSMGITKNVNRYANNPIIIQDIFKVFANHVDQMSSYNGFVTSESDMNKFLNYKAKRDDGEVESVKEEMSRTMGPKAITYIKTLMHRLVTASGLSDDSDFPQIFVRNMKVASVGANLRVIVQQPTAYLRAANYISPKYLFHPAVFQKTNKETIYQYAPIALWKNWGNYEMDTGKTMYEQIIAPSKFQKTKDMMLAGAGAADRWTWSRLWNACVLEAKDKHPKAEEGAIYEAAGERFSAIVDESQVVDSILHRSQIMRRKAIYTQMATSFMSESIKTFNLASNALVEMIRDNTPENRKKFIRCYMTIIATGLATASAAGLVDAMRDDDDEEEFLEKWKKAVRGDYSEAESPKDFVMAALSSNIGDTLNPMGMIPYLRDLWSIIQGYDIKRTDFDWMNDILKSMKRWKDFIAGESEYTLSAMLMNTAGSLSKLVGIPIGSAARDLKAMGNLIVYHIIGEDELSYRYRKESKEIGSEKNLGDYVERMLRARLTGNDKLATEIYNDMIRAGISNKKIDDRMDSKERKRLKEEPAAAEGAEAYRRGDYAGYTAALDTLLKKGYGRKNAISVMESIYQKKGVEDAEGEETFTTITDGYWDEGEEEPVGYEMLYNAYMNGSEEDYAEMQQRLLEQGKEDKNIRQSMRSRLKDAYKEASEAGDYEKAQKARSEFLRLGGKPEILLKP